MRTFSTIKGMSVIDEDTGNEIGMLEDLSFSPNGMLNGIIVNPHRWFRHSQVFLFNEIKGIGTDHIIVTNHSTSIPSDSYTFIKDIQKKQMVSNHGKNLGLLEDVYFQENLGTILGYELSDGFISDITEGRKVIETNQTPVIGEEYIIINDLENP